MRRPGKSAAGLGVAALALACMAVPAAVVSSGGVAHAAWVPHAGPGSADTTPSTTTPTSLPAPTTTTTGSDIPTSTTSTDPTGTTATTSPATGGSTSTTGGPAGNGGTSGTSGSGPAGGAGSSSGSASSSPGASGSASPPDPRLEALAATVPRTGATTTWPLLIALAPLQHFGLTQLQTALVGFGNFPVAGPAWYTDDWLEYRALPTPHLHQGIDIVAPPGTPLRSPTDGTLTYSNSDPDGYGLTAVVTQPDRTTFVLAHMSATVLGLATGAQVTTGQVVGFVGATGDANGPHCHFEVHPRGGAAVDGKPLLDHWLAQALAAAPGLITAFRDARSPSAQPPVVTVPDSVPIAPINHVPDRAQLSGAAPVRAAGGPPFPVRFGGAIVGLGVAAVAGWSLFRRRRSAVSTA